MRNRRVHLNLKSILKERNIEQKELAEMTGLTTRTISVLANNKMKQIPKNAIEAIANALNIDDISEIITLVDDDDDGYPSFNKIDKR